MAKCSECGFLSLRNRYDYSLNEADIDFREKGIVATVYNEDGRNPHKLQRDIPLCLAMYQYLGDAFKVLAEPSNPSKQVTSVIQTDNDCKEFVKWQQGFTPKEHQEMLDRQWMLDYQAKRDKGDKDWRESQEQLHNRQEWRRYIFLGIFTLIAAVIGGLVTWLVTKG